MAVEIERKFRVASDAWRPLADAGHRLCQGYLSTDRERTVRVRLQGEEAWLTIKGITVGASRPEYEYSLPAADARFMLEHLCLRPLLDKTRYCVEYEGLIWEVDVFHGDNAGLVVAEVELPDEDFPLTLPAWVGDEVTGDPRYYNSSLIQRPFATWQSGPPTGERRPAAES